MEIKNEIRICLGSSCFARGNKQTVHAIRDYLKNHQLSEKIYFHGAHCFGNCVNGPCIEVNQKLHEHIDPENALLLIENETT